MHQEHTIHKTHIKKSIYLSYWEYKTINVKDNIISACKTCQEQLVPQLHVTLPKNSTPARILSQYD